MRTTTEEEIIKELRKSVERHRDSAQRYRQLRSALSGSSTPVVGDALLQYWQTLVDPDGHFVAQQFVARLLLDLNPPTSLTLRQLLAGLRNWNLSVEEFPRYLALQFGEDRVRDALCELEGGSPGDEVLLRAAAAARFWLRPGWTRVRQG